MSDRNPPDYLPFSQHPDFRSQAQVKKVEGWATLRGSICRLIKNKSDITLELRMPENGNIITEKIPSEKFEDVREAWATDKTIAFIRYYDPLKYPEKSANVIIFKSPRAQKNGKWDDLPRSFKVIGKPTYEIQEERADAPGVELLHVDVPNGKGKYTFYIGQLYGNDEGKKREIIGLAKNGSLLQVSLNNDIFNVESVRRQWTARGITLALGDQQGGSLHKVSEKTCYGKPCNIAIANDTFRVCDEISHRPEFSFDAYIGRGDAGSVLRFKDKLGKTPLILSDTVNSNVISSLHAEAKNTGQELVLQLDPQGRFSIKELLPRYLKPTTQADFTPDWRDVKGEISLRPANAWDNDSRPWDTNGIINLEDGGQIFLPSSERNETVCKLFSDAYGKNISVLCKLSPEGSLQYKLGKVNISKKSQTRHRPQRSSKNVVEALLPLPSSSPKLLNPPKSSDLSESSAERHPAKRVASSMASPKTEESGLSIFRFEGSDKWGPIPSASFQSQIKEIGEGQIILFPSDDEEKSRILLRREVEKFLSPEKIREVGTWISKEIPVLLLMGAPNAKVELHAQPYLEMFHREKNINSKWEFRGKCEIPLKGESMTFQGLIFSSGQEYTDIIPSSDTKEEFDLTSETLLRFPTKTLKALLENETPIAAGKTLQITGSPQKKTVEATVGSPRSCLKASQSGWQFDRDAFASRFPGHLSGNIIHSDANYAVLEPSKTTRDSLALQDGEYLSLPVGALRFITGRTAGATITQRNEMKTNGEGNLPKKEVPIEVKIDDLTNVTIVPGKVSSSRTKIHKGR